MKPHVIVFTVLMLQTFLAIGWFKLSADAFGIWIIGCIVADIFTWTTWSDHK